MIGFWNVKTLLCQDDKSQLDQNSRFLQLEREFAKYKLGILGVSETRWLGSGVYSSGSTVFLYSGKDEGSRYAGVGFMLSKTIYSSLISWKPISERLIVARFSSRVRNISIIQCYAPTDYASDTDKDDFYSLLNATYSSVPRGDIVIVMGDLNAQIGCINSSMEHIMGKRGVGTCTNNGERFTEFCNTQHLVIGGSIFQHRTRDKLTFCGPAKRKTQIDHFAISQRFRGCLEDVRNRRGADIGTLFDHYLVVAVLRLRTAALKKDNEAGRPSTFFVELLRSNTICKEFSNRLKSTTQELVSQPESSIADHWEGIKNAFISTGKDIVGPKSSKRRPWMSDNTWDLIERRTLVKAKILDGNDLSAEYRAFNKEIKKCTKRDKRTHIDLLSQTAKEAADVGDMGTVYRITKELVCKTTKCDQPVVGLNGDVLSTTDDQLGRWREHFSIVLNHLIDDSAFASASPLPHQNSCANININDPNCSEIAAAINSMPNKKAAGVDGIPAEFYKADVGLSAKLLQPLLAKAWQSCVFPDEWTDGIIVKIPKKGNLKICDNWRGISVLPAVSKIIEKIVLERMKKAIYATIAREQAGFISGSSCIDHINTLRLVIEQCAEHRSPLHLAFVDFEKAFDSIDRNCIWNALSRRGTPQKIINIIRATYEGAKCRVLHNGKLSEPFEVKSGVRQGCILSPMLFLIVLDDVISAALHPHVKHCRIQWNFTTFLQHLDYAETSVLWPIKF